MSLNCARVAVPHASNHKRKTPKGQGSKGPAWYASTRPFCPPWKTDPPQWRAHTGRKQSSGREDCRPLHRASELDHIRAPVWWRVSVFETRTNIRKGISWGRSQWYDQQLRMEKLQLTRCRKAEPSDRYKKLPHIVRQRNSALCTQWGTQPHSPYQTLLCRYEPPAALFRNRS